MISGRALCSWRTVLATIACVSALTACGSDDESSQQSGSTDTSAASGADEDFDPAGVLRVGLHFTQSQGVTAFDPRISFTGGDIGFLGALYAPLMTFDPETGEYTPYLAESVETLDARTVQVTLREDALFDNGDPVTADDAKASIESAAQNSRDGEALGLEAGIRLVEEVTVDDPRTFTIHLSQDGLGVIFQLLAGRETMIVPAGAGPEQNEQPIGTGPFRFVSMTPGQSIHMERSETFFDADTVRLAGIEFINLPSGTPQANALLSGDIDLSSGTTGGLDSAGFNQLSSSDEVETASFVTGISYLFLSMCKADGAFFADEQVRVALQYGTDREQLAQVWTEGLGVAATQWVPPDSPFYLESIAEEYAYDPDRAAEMIEQAGVSGESVNIVVTSQVPRSEVVGLALKEQWAQIGITVNLVQTDDIVADYYSPGQTGDPLPENQGAVTTFPRAEPFEFLFTPDSLINTCNYQDPLIAEAISSFKALAPDDPERVELWHEVSEHIATTNPAMPVAFNPSLYAWSERVGGITQSILGFGQTTSTRYVDLFIKS